ncbi:hypothetical protein J6590_104344, partial [Homalodisca vitripennis]
MLQGFPDKSALTETAFAGNIRLEPITADQYPTYFFRTNTSRTWFPKLFNWRVLVCLVLLL